MRWSVLGEEKEVEQMFAWKEIIMPILQPKLLGRVDINTHITDLHP